VMAESQIVMNPETGLFEAQETVPDTGVIVPDTGVIVPDTGVIVPDSPVDLTGSQDTDTTNSIDIVGGDSIGGNSSESSDTGASLPDQAEDETDVSESEDMADYDSYINLASAAPSVQSYSVQPWQLNLAENRQIGEHYLIWAERVYYGSYNNYYWHYFAAVGKDIEKNGDMYVYADADLYDLYSYDNTTTYQMQQSSGSVNGSSFVVYSDLYFDYVGTASTVSVPFILVGLLLIITMLLIIALRRK
jgi:hypothetical protein